MIVFSIGVKIKMPNWKRVYLGLVVKEVKKPVHIHFSLKLPSM